jgi:MFS family permease
MTSIGAAVLSLVRIPGAYIADKYGRKQIIATMTFIIAISALFYAFAPDWRFVLIGMVITNLCLIYQPALQAILADSIPSEKREMGYAAVNVVPSIPTIVAPAIAGILVMSLGLIPGMRIVYSLLFLCSLGAALTRFLLLKETLETPKKIRLGELKNAFKKSLGSIVEAWREMPRSLKFLTLALIISSFEDPMWFLFESLFVFDVVMITGLEWGLLNVVFTATTLILGLGLGKVIHKIGKKRSLVITYLFIFTPSSILFIMSRNFSMLFIAHIVFGIGFCMANPAFNALQADLIPKEKRGRIMGTIGTLNVLATIPAAFIGGILYEIDPTTPFIFGITLGIVVGLLILFAVKEPETRED